MKIWNFEVDKILLILKESDSPTLNNRIDLLVFSPISDNPVSNVINFH